MYNNYLWTVYYWLCCNFFLHCVMSDKQHLCDNNVVMPMLTRVVKMSIIVIIIMIYKMRMIRWRCPETHECFAIFLIWCTSTHEYTPACIHCLLECTFTVKQIKDNTADFHECNYVCVILLMRLQTLSDIDQMYMVTFETCTCWALVNKNRIIYSECEKWCWVHMILESLY